MTYMSSNDFEIIIRPIELIFYFIYLGGKKFTDLLLKL